MNSKRKGTGGEQELSELLRKHGIRAYRNDQIFVKGKYIPDVAAEIGDVKLHIEVKRVERLNVLEAIKQAVRDVYPGMVPVVAHRKNREPWLITVRLSDLLDVLEENVLRPLCETGEEGRG